MNYSNIEEVSAGTRLWQSKTIYCMPNTLHIKTLNNILSRAQSLHCVPSISDILPNCIFHIFIYRYLYCDEIQLEADTVLATLYVAKKYIVPHLARACVNYLETSLTAKNACLLLSQSRLFEEPELMQRCWEVIDAQVRLSQSLSALQLDSSSDSYHIVHPRCNDNERIMSS
jgi:hypothetical protein